MKIKNIEPVNLTLPGAYEIVLAVGRRSEEPIDRCGAKLRTAKLYGFVCSPEGYAVAPDRPAPVRIPFAGLVLTDRGLERFEALDQGQTMGPIGGVE